ncbi:MAG: hypothetical protein J6D38_06915 [Solobacterium sp.]|nr:hypothetical protein [Solobacterium sp.]
MVKRKRMMIAAIGCLVLGIGIGLCDHAQLGTDPFTVLLVGIQKHIRFTIGTKTVSATIGSLNLVVALLMILFGFLVDRKMISIVSFLAPFFTSVGIDLIGLLFPSPVHGQITPFIFLLIGELLYATGTSLCIFANAGYDPYNSFLIGIQKLTGWKYKTVRWTVEIVFLLVGYLLGGTVGIGTAIALLLTAPLAERMVSFLKQKWPL